MKERDLLGQILPVSEEPSSYVVRSRLWEGAVGNTTPAALSRAILLNTGLSAGLYGETKMPDEIDEAEKFLREYKKVKRKMLDKGNEEFLEKLLRKEGMRWEAGSVTREIIGNTVYFSVGSSSSSTYNNRPLTYEESHDFKNYKCGLCGRGPVQLWREGKKNYDPPPRILCIWCVGDVMGRNYRGQLEDVDIILESSFMGWVPAIPYNNNGECLIIPPNTTDSERYGVNWWLGLKR